MVAAIGMVLAWMLPEHPLRTSVAAAAGDVGEEMTETFPMPSDRDPMAQLVLGMSVLADRDVQRKFIERIVERAGVDLLPASAWLLLRFERDPTADPHAIGRAQHVPADRIEAALSQLEQRRLVDRTPGSGGRPRRELTAAGCEVFARLAAARRERLAELFKDWEPERHERMAELLGQLAVEMVPDVQRPESSKEKERPA